MGHTSYIYALLDSNGVAFYVGKTNHPKNRLNLHRSTLRSRPTMVILETVPEGGDWRESETKWIAEYRKHHTLTNIAKGGNGRHSFALSTRQKLSKIYKERYKTSEKMRAALALGWVGLKEPLPGERNGRAKITAADVLKIRELCVAGELSQEEIGKRYGITQMMVSRIFTRRAWKHVA